MDRRPQGLSDADLERQLARLGRQLAYPPAPDLAPSVRNQLALPARGRGWRPMRPSPRFGLVLGASVLAVLIVLAIPGTRSGIAERLGLRGVEVRYVATVPVPSATPLPTAATTPAGIGSQLMLGERATIPEALSRVPFTVLVPPTEEYGLPDALYVSASPPGGYVALVYAPRSGLPRAADTGVGLLLVELRGTLETPLVSKMLGPDTQMERVTVQGAPGYWIEGGPHAVVFRDANGQVRDDRIRLAGNTLLWERDGVTYRLESALPKDGALRIAERLVPLGRK